MRDALAVRLTLDLIGGEGGQLCGVPPSCAGTYVSNAPVAARDNGFETFADLVVSKAFPGTVIFEGRREGGDGLRFARWFAGPVENPGPWIAETGKGENAHPVRLLLADAGRAASRIVMDAREPGINDHAEDERI